MATSTHVTDSESAIACVDLHKRYPDIHAVRGVDLVVRRGECLALLGPNGAGKTTTVEMIEGLTEPTSGRIAVFGHTWGQGAASDQHIREIIGVCLQESNFQERLKVVETIDLFRSFYRNPDARDALVAMVGLESKAGAMVGKLSGGQRQRMALACALAGRPRLICLDEPTTGLDPQSRRQVWTVIERFRSGGGSVLLTTHYMEEAAQLADRVAIMDAGQIIALGTPAELIASLGARDIAAVDFDRPGQSSGFSAIPGVGEVRDVPNEAGWRLRIAASSVAAVLPGILAEASAQGLVLLALSTHQATLEDVFIHYTGRQLRDD